MQGLDAMEPAAPIYLDHAAATPIDERVLEAMMPYLTGKFANPSAAYSAARKVREDIEDARSRIAALMGAKPGNIVFTAGATEANNLALRTVSEDAHVIASSIEHESVRACVEKMDSHTLLPVDGQGVVNAGDLERAIRPETELVTIALANGEIGVIQPVRELARAVQAERSRRLQNAETRPIFFHTDASQAAALKNVNVSALEADMVTLSAAKMHGLKQVGLLWARSGIEVKPLLCGGGQEGGLRSGTENVAGIMGFAAAFEMVREGQKEEAARQRRLRDMLQSRLVEAFDWAVVAGPKKASMRLDNLLSISFPGIDAKRLVIMLDNRGVCVGTGSACAASKMTVSPVLLATGMPEDVAQGSLRITLGRDNTEEQVDAAASAIIDAVREEMERTGMRR